MEKQTISARISGTLAENFKLEAEQQGVSQRVLLERALTMYLKSTAESGPSLPNRVATLERTVAAMSEHIDVLGHALMQMDKAGSAGRGRQKGKAVKSFG